MSVKEMWQKFKVLIVSAGVVFLIVLFQNTDALAVKFLFWELSLPRFVFILLIALSAAAVGFLAGKNS